MNPIVKQRVIDIENADNFELGGFADHTTPLIRDCWYVAALTHEISREVISKRLLGVDVALYRTLAGKAVAVRKSNAVFAIPFLLEFVV
jgi:vanillate O-demethylase monooxygenase subunit